MTAVSNSHTVLWVPRYWPAVGGTEFHSHELAVHLSQSQRVTVLAHCTTTEYSQQPLTVSAAQAQFSDTTTGDVRHVKLAPEKQFVNVLSWLGKFHSKNMMARMIYQLFFKLAYRKLAMAILKDANRIHFIYNGLTEAATLAAQQAAELDIPFIFTPNILDTSEYGSDWDSPSFHKLYACADQLIALTEHEAQWLINRGVDKKKISVVPYGPILKPREPSHETGNASELLSTRFILFLGRLVPGKGSNVLLSAFESLCDSDSITQLIMVSPPDNSTHLLISQLNVRLKSTRVHLLQDVSQPFKTALLEEAAVLCVPSERESLGGVYIEAMASKTPVIALDRPVSRCVIEHNKEGLLVSGDQTSVIDGLRTILDNPTLADNMGRAGVETVASRYSWPVVTNKILSVYSKVEDVSSLEMKKAA